MDLKPSSTVNEFPYTKTNPRNNKYYKNIDRIKSYINVPKHAVKSQSFLTVRLLVVELYKHKESGNFIIDVRNIKSICHLDPSELETIMRNGFPVMVINGKYYRALSHICRRYNADVYTLTKSGLR